MQLQKVPMLWFFLVVFLTASGPSHGNSDYLEARAWRLLLYKVHKEVSAKDPFPYYDDSPSTTANQIAAVLHTLASAAPTDSDSPRQAAMQALQDFRTSYLEIPFHVGGKMDWNRIMSPLLTAAITVIQDCSEADWHSAGRRFAKTLLEGLAQGFRGLAAVKDAELEQFLEEPLESRIERRKKRGGSEEPPCSEGLLDS